MTYRGAHEVVGMAGERLLKRNWEVDGWSVVLECRFPSTTAHFKSDVLLSSLDDDVTAT